MPSLTHSSAHVPPTHMHFHVNKPAWFYPSSQPQSRLSVYLPVVKVNICRVRASDRNPGDNEENCLKRSDILPERGLVWICGFFLFLFFRSAMSPAGTEDSILWENVDGDKSRLKG